MIKPFALALLLSVVLSAPVSAQNAARTPVAGANLANPYGAVNLPATGTASSTAASGSGNTTAGAASGSGGSSGFDSVTDALLRAGVPHVVASRWAVDSTGTRGFVQDFYRNALSGHTVSDAIRLTSRNMLANPRTSHPYYWSAFAAYGRP